MNISLCSVSIIIINFNGEKCIEECLQLVFAQSYPNKEIIIIDNNSTDHSLQKINEFAKRHAVQHISEIQILRNTQNIGYSKAANQGIRKAKGDYIMILNPDAFLEKNYIEEIVDYGEKHQDTGAFTGKLLKYDLAKNKKTHLIDSLGLFSFRNRRIIDRGQGLEDAGQFDKIEEVFGVSGAAPIYRKKALEDIKIQDEYFDEDFFMYKEDIDISWRMRLLGWKAVYIPQAVAYHARGTGVLKRFSNIEVVKNRRHLSQFQKSHAYVNQRLMQIKNELPGNLFHDLPQILWKEMLIFGYICLREPYLIKSIFDVWKKIPRCLRKRKEIMKKKKVSAKQMQHWFQSNASRGNVVASRNGGKKHIFQRNTK